MIRNLWRLTIIVLSLSFAFATIDNAWQKLEQGEVQASLIAFKNSAENNDADAAFIYGMLLLEPSLKNYNPQKGRFWLERAADEGNAKAAYNLAYLYLFEWAELENAQAQLQFYLTKAQRAGIVEASLFKLAYSLDHSAVLGSMTAEESIVEIKNAYQLAQIPLTHYYMGLLYLYADQLQTDIPYDLNQAAEHLEAAFNGGVLKAAFALKELYQKQSEESVGNSKKQAFYEDFVDQHGYSLLYDGEREVGLISIFKERTAQSLITMIERLQLLAESDGEAAQLLGMLYLKEIIPVSIATFSAIPSQRLAEVTAVAKSYFLKAFELGELSAAINLYYISDDASTIIPYLEQAADADNIQALRILSEIADSEIKDDYLLKAASLGDLDAMIKVADFYERGYINGKSDRRAAINWYQKIITQYPDDPRAYYQMAITLNSQFPLQPQLDEIHTYFEQAVALAPQNFEYLARFAQFYNEGYRGYDSPDKSLALYEQIIHFDSNEVGVDNALLLKALLLKNGKSGADGNVNKDEQAANALFTQILQKYPNDSPVLYELADSYHYGKGVPVDEERAITLYTASEYFKANLPLGELLLKSADLETREKGFHYLVEATKFKGQRDAAITLMLPFKETSIAVNKWLISEAVEPDFRNQFDAKALALDACQPEEKGYCYARSLLLLLSKSDPKRGLSGLIALAEQNDERAIKALIEYYKEQYDFQNAAQWSSSLATLTQKDIDRFSAADLCFSIGEYDQSLAWYQQIEKPTEVMKYNQDRVLVEIENLEKLQIAAQKGEWEAAEQLYYIYDQNNNRTAAIALLTPFVENDISIDLTLDPNISVETRMENARLAEQKRRVMELLIRQLDASKDEDNIQRATQYYLQLARVGDESAYSRLYDRYTEGVDQTIKRSDLERWMVEYSILKENPNHYYLEVMKEFDAAFANQHSDDREIKMSSLQQLARSYDIGYGIRKDPAELVAVLKVLAEQGDSEAAHTLGEYYRTGKIEGRFYPDILTQDWAKSAYYYALDSRNTSDNEDEAMTDSTEKLIFYKEVVVPAEKGDLLASYQLAKTYLESDDFHDNYDLHRRGISLLESAANSNIADAQYTLAQYYGDRLKDRYHQRIWLEKAVMNHSAAAKLTLAKLLIAHMSANDLSYNLGAITPFSEQIAEREAAIISIVTMLEAAGESLPEANVVLIDFYLTIGQWHKAELHLATLPSAEQIDLYPKLGAAYERGGEDRDSDFKKAHNAYQKAYDNGDLLYGLKKAWLYFIGDQQLPQDKGQGLIELEAVFEQILLQGDLYLQDDVIYTSQKLIREGVESRKVGLKWLEKLLLSHNLYAAAVLSDIYKQERNYGESYFYARIGDAWRADKIAPYLQEGEQEVLDQRAEKLLEEIALGQRY